jgi:hypothetical protein
MLYQMKRERKPRFRVNVFAIYAEENAKPHAAWLRAAKYAAFRLANVGAHLPLQRFAASATSGNAATSRVRFIAASLDVSSICLRVEGRTSLPIDWSSAGSVRKNK